MALIRDYYIILGVAPVASPEEIQRAYRALSRKYHPDLNPHLKSIAADSMKQLVEAYNVLNDQNKRKEYDAQPHLQVRRFKKGPGERKSSYNTLDAKFKSEPSILERLFSSFFKKDSFGESGTKIDPRQADVQFTMGLSMAEQESMFPEAKKAFKDAIKFDPNFVEAYFNLAIMCYKLGEFKEARKNFRKVLEFNSNDATARKVLNLIKDDEDDD
jgi:DnaJ-class molecular chaperone